MKGALWRPVPRSDRRYRWLRYAVAVLALVCGSPAMGKQAPWTGSTLTTPHATVYYYPGAEELAETAGQVFEFGYEAVAEDVGYPANPLDIYIYGSAEEMTAALQARPEYGETEVRAIVHVGISPRRNDALHLHPKIRKWGANLWYAIIHEHVHGVTEQRFGPALPDSARWVYEGLGEYESFHVIEERLPEYVQRERTKRLKAVFKALVMLEGLSLEMISTEERWSANILRDESLWLLQYATAYAAVDYLVREHGFDRLVSMLEGIGSGLTWPDAMEQAIEMSAPRFEAGFHFSLFLTGVFDLYWHYSAALVAAVLCVLLAVWLAVRQMRRTRT